MTRTHSMAGKQQQSQIAATAAVISDNPESSLPGSLVRSGNSGLPRRKTQPGSQTAARTNSSIKKSCFRVLWAWKCEEQRQGRSTTAENPARVSNGSKNQQQHRKSCFRFLWASWLYREQRHERSTTTENQPGSKPQGKTGSRSDKKGL